MAAMYKAPKVNNLSKNDVVLCKNMYKMPNVMSFETSKVKILFILYVKVKKLNIKND